MVAPVTPASTGKKQITREFNRFGAVIEVPYGLGKVAHYPLRVTVVESDVHRQRMRFRRDDAEQSEKKIVNLLSSCLKAFVTCAATLRSPVAISAAEATPESVAVADCTRL